MFCLNIENTENGFTRDFSFGKSPLKLLMVSMIVILDEMSDKLNVVLC